QVVGRRREAGGRLQPDQRRLGQAEPGVPDCGGVGEPVLRQRQRPAQRCGEERPVAPAGGAGRRVRGGAAALAEGGRRGDQGGRAGVQGRGRRPAGGQGAADREGSPQGRRPGRDEGGGREGQGGRVHGEAEGGDEAADAELVLRRRRQGAVRRVLRLRA